MILCFLLLTLTGLCVAIPPLTNRVQKTTIFGEEKLKGGIFYQVDDETVPLNDDINYRLPTSSRPIHYDVFIATNFNSGNLDAPRTFSGRVVIQLVATEPNVAEIVIHAHDLEITEEPMLSLNEVVVPSTYTFDNFNNEHFMRISLLNDQLQYSALEDIVYELTVTFEAPMRNDMYGIYDSWYKTGEDIKYMASTHFQATSARSAFPCYDEPGLKATFNISIRRSQDYRSWSNTRLEDSYPVENSTDMIDVFYRTPVMSTYLIALLIAEYQSVTNGEEPLSFEVIARPDAINNDQSDYALEVGQELLAMMSEHTGYDYYDMGDNFKMTHASIPDFSAGAMENWGLLVYREAYLMYDGNHTDSHFKQRIAYILSHEIAHMWFGNLVTCNWWDNFWLNEGFARYYQYYLTDWVETEMGFDTRFVTEQVHTALLADSANNPHPLTNPGIGSPVAIRSMFGTITYNKGASIIRMTEHLLGFEVHRRGLQIYLRERAFNTSLPIHLFQALQDEAERSGAIAEYGPDFSVIDYYRSFTEQSGAPILNVNINHQTGDMVIHQNRFNINSGYSNVHTIWIVPINFASESNPDFDNTKPTHILRDTVSVINRGTVGDEWVIFNKQQIGYYRVNYDDYTWDIITATLRSESRRLIHEHNRAQIVDDVFQFARSGLMSYTRAFNILSFLEFETSYAPWVAAISGFNWIRNRWATQQNLEELDAMIAKWTQQIMNVIGYESLSTDSFMTSYLRQQMSEFVCNLGVEACRTAANQQLAGLITSGDEVAVDNRLWVYCNGLRQGNVNDFNALWDRFNTHYVYTEKILLLQVLGCTPDRQSLYTLLDAIVQENHIIRRQDYTTAFNSAITGNEDNRHIVFDYIKENLQEVIDGFRNAATPLSYISSRLRTQEEVEEFRAWAEENQATIGNDYNAVYNGASSSLESIDWANTVSTDINNFIDEDYQEVAFSTSTLPPVVQPPIIQPPTIVRPVPPELPDSASSAFISIFLLAAAFIVNAMF